MWVCVGHHWFVGEIVLVPYVVGAVTMLRVLLFVLDMRMLRGCEADGNVGVGHEYVDGTGGSGIEYSAADMLGLSMVHGIRGVGGVCVWLMVVWGEWISGLDLDFTNPVRTGGVLDVCLCLGCGGCCCLPFETYGRG